MKPSASPVDPSLREATPAKCLVQCKSLFRSQEGGKEKLSPPSGFCFTPAGNLVLADDFNHRIQIYDPGHKLIKSFCGKGKKPGELHYPRGIAVDGRGNIYVADSWNHRVQKFDAEGRPLLSMGSCGEGKGQLNEPYDVFIDPKDNILVVERYNHRIQIFDPEGHSKGWVGGRGTVLEEELAHIYETPKHLFNAPAFEFPTSIARDSLGNYFITDSGNHRILKFDSDWNLLFSFGERGKGPAQFEYPLCVSAGPKDLLYVADLNNDRVQVFTSTGIFLVEINQANDAIPLNAPGLTAIDPDGTLHVGLTFDARVLTFQIPQISGEDLLTEHFEDRADDPRYLYHRAERSCQGGDQENARKAIRDAAQKIIADKTAPDEPGNPAQDHLLKLSRLALSIEDPQTESVLLQGFENFSRHLETSRQAVLTTHRQWEEAATDHHQRLFAEQHQVLEQREDSNVFNKDLFQAEILDKTLFRKLRQQFYTYRVSVEQGSEFFANVIHSGLSKSGLKSCMDVMEAHLARICEIVIHLLEDKETREKAMLESFGETQNQDGKWETFLLKSLSCARIMDVLRQFHFEITSLLANIKGAALKYPTQVDVENTLRTQFIELQGSEKFLKILLGFQQEWPLHKTLEAGLKDFMDLWMTGSATAGNAVSLELEIPDLEPVPYDSEELILKAMAQPLLVEAMALRKSEAGVALGHLFFSSPALSQNGKGFIKKMQSVLDNEQHYEIRHHEGLEQLEALSLQKQELEAKLFQVNPQDKKAPITLQNNISVLTFQISLLRRMLLTMEINEAGNLLRLVLGTALWMRENEAENSSAAEAFWKAVDSFYTDLESKINQGLEEVRTLHFQTSRLEEILNTLEKSNDVGDLNRTLEIKDQVLKVLPGLEKRDAHLNRRFKIRNMFHKLLDFKDTGASKTASLPDRAASYPFMFSFGSGGPLTHNRIQPFGITRTHEGDFILADHENHRVMRFSGQGVYKNHFGGWGNSPGFFQHPVHVHVDRQGCLYVSDEKNCRIQKFTGEGKFLSCFGDGDNEEHNLGPLRALSIDRDDRVWVADAAHNRIQIYSSDGEWIRCLQNENNSPEELCQPVSICCLENGEYLVGDKSPWLLKHFGQDGKLIRGLKKENLGLGEIYFITWHPDHGIFITDYWSNQVIGLDSSLQVISVLRNPGRRAGQFGKVGGLALSDGHLAVADPENFRVQVLECFPLKSDS